MRTKPIFPKLALATFMFAASTWQCPAPVGYYNVQLAAGWTLLANQLDLDGTGNNNTVYTVIGAQVPDGTLLYKFDAATQNYYDAFTFLTGVGWYPLSGNTNDPVLKLPCGEGVFIWTPQANVVTIVGNVMQGPLVNQIPANYSLKASMVPQAGLLQTDLAFPPYAGDKVWRWASPAFSAYTFGGTVPHWVPSQPSVNVGEGFFVYRDPAQATPDHWWTRNFTVAVATAVSPLPVSKTAGSAADVSTAAEIRGLSFRDGKVVLDIKNASGTPYNIQFSPDGVSWKTISTGQTAKVWQEQLRGGEQGYYQLVNP